MSDGTGNEAPIPTSVLSKGEATTLALGTILQERYQVDRVVGLGGMGAVYRVRDLHFQATVKWLALKEMIIKFADNFDQEQRKLTFEREANLLADLEHPAIPQVHDFFYAAHRAYLVLEYINGKDLEAVLSDSDDFLDEQMVVNWAIQLCDVLHYLHSYEPTPIVFRDLKPSNVMLTPSNHIMLIDFGIAKAFQPGIRGTMIGTAGYSPPEQYRGQAEPAGDIYALGAMLHQLLTHSDPRLETPFTFHERLPRALNPSISAEVEDVVMKCLAYEIDERWQSALELKAALENALHPRRGTGTGVLQRNFVPPFAPPPAFGPSANGRGYPPYADAQNDPINAPSADSDVFHIAAGPRFSPQPSDFNPDASLSQRQAEAAPLGQKQAQPQPQPANAAYQAIRPVNSNHQRQNVNAPLPLWNFEAEEEVRSSAAMAHNTVYIGSYDHNLYALDAQTGKMKWLFSADEGICCTPACFGDLVIVGSEDYSVYAVNSQTGHLEWNYHTKDFVRSSPRVFRDQVVVGSDDNHVHAIDVHSARMLWKFKTWGPVRSSAIHYQGLIFIGSEDNRVYALEATTGAEKWKHTTQHSVTSSPVVSDGLVYVGSMDGTVYALEAKAGWLTWRFHTNHFITASPLVREGRIYIGSVDTYFYCLDAQTGRLMWKFQADGQITSSAAFHAGFVYFGCNDGAVYGLDARNGQLCWKFQTGGPVPSSPLIRDGVLYIGSNDHHIYALPCAT
ncbi:MAG TPA: serine/threonine-protein kinase [Ktedonobacterales bacterium]|jgi:outer membrane protein assembly factor BamB/tRNA A-37 threonylcarbamoyl transferase component Bud32